MVYLFNDNKVSNVLKYPTQITDCKQAIFIDNRMMFSWVISDNPSKVLRN